MCVNGNRLEEWKALREEIRQKQAFDKNLIITMTSGNILIYAFALQGGDFRYAICSLMPVILTTVVYLWLLLNQCSTMKVVRYVRKMEEVMPGLDWETWRNRGRINFQVDHHDTGKPNGGTTKDPHIFDVYLRIYQIFYIVSAIVAITCVWIPKHFSDNIKVWISIGIAALVVSCYFLVRKLWVKPLKKQIHAQITM